MLAKLVELVGKHELKRPLSRQVENQGKKSEKRKKLSSKKLKRSPTTFIDLQHLELRNRIADVFRELRESLDVATHAATKAKAAANAASMKGSEDSDVIEAKRRRASVAIQEQDRSRSTAEDEATRRVQALLEDAGVQQTGGALRAGILKSGVFAARIFGEPSAKEAPIRAAESILRGVKLVSARRLATTVKSAQTAYIEHHASVQEWLLPYAVELAGVPEYLRVATIAAAVGGGTRRKRRSKLPH